MIINLDKNFAPFGSGTAVETFVFPSGCEVHVKLPNIHSESAMITTRIKSSDDVMTLLMATDALRRCGVPNIELLIPYVPYARQDRQMVKGEPLSLKVFANLINSQGYTKVYVYDVHSETSLALIDNNEGVTNHLFVDFVLNGKTNYLIVSPDAGAYKKIFKVCQYINYKHEIILCNKVRNVSTGAIEQTTIPVEDFQGMDLYIIDDICDGGGTFVLLANELRKRNCGTINLVVSHGIFSKGTQLGNIDHIYTTNSFKDLPLTTGLTQIKLDNGLLY